MVILIASEWLLDNGWPWRVSTLESYMNRKKNDDWTHNAFEIQRIKNRDRDEAGESFVFLGGSISLEVVDSDDNVSREISRLTGKPAFFKSICASYQTPADDAKIIKELGDFGGTVLIGIEPLTFKATQDRQLHQMRNNGDDHLKYYYLDSFGAINDILLKHGYDVQWDQNYRLTRSAKVFGEIIKKRAILALTSLGKKRHILYDRHAVGDKTPVTEKKKIAQRKWLRKLRMIYDYASELNLDLLRLGIDVAKANGNRVIIVDLPVNPIYEKEYALFQPEYDEMVRKLVNENGLGYIDMRDSGGWKPEDFRDVHHMRSVGQKRFSPILARKLVNYLEIAGSYGGNS